MTRSLRTLAAIHLAGNALLLWLGYYWLGVGESRALTLLWSLLLAVLLLCGACWLHGGAFAYFRGKTSPVDAFRNTLRFVPALMLVAIGALVVYFLLARWADYSGQPVFKIASWLTLKLRRPAKPASIQRIFDAGLWLMRWMVVPVFLLPLISGVSVRGFGGLREIGRGLRDRRLWLLAPVLLWCALGLPLRIMGWSPRLSGFSMQMVSFTIRLLIAYALFVAGGLAVAFASRVPEKYEPALRKAA